MLQDTAIPTARWKNPTAQWNLVELVVQGDHVKQYLNGKFVNEGSEAYPSSGKILDPIGRRRSFLPEYQTVPIEAVDGEN